VVERRGLLLQQVQVLEVTVLRGAGVKAVAVVALVAQLLGLVVLAVLVDSLRAVEVAALQ
jgi:hypothetical protein